MKLRDVTYIEEFPRGVFKCYSDPPGIGRVGADRPDKIKKILLHKWIRIRFPQSGQRLAHGMLEGLLVSSMGFER